MPATFFQHFDGRHCSYNCIPYLCFYFHDRLQNGLFFVTIMIQSQRTRPVLTERVRGKLSKHQNPRRPSNSSSPVCSFVPRQMEGVLKLINTLCSSSATDEVIITETAFSITSVLGCLPNSRANGKRCCTATVMNPCSQMATAFKHFVQHQSCGRDICPPPGALHKGCF